MAPIPREAQLLDLAARRGLLTSAELEASIDAPEALEARYGALVDRLIRAGRLEESVVRSLLAEIAAGDDTKDARADGRRGEPAASAQKTQGNTSATLPAAFAQCERYEIKRRLGSGGMGVVYEALDRKLGRTVALKFIHGKDEPTARRLLREARSQARVRHPNVCNVHDVGELAGQPFVAMDYLAGEPLLQATRRMSIEQKVHVVKDIAEALQAAHHLGIIHRDVKPANVIVEEREDGELHPTIMDFGLARGAGDDEHFTVSGAVLGTPAYMPPEQARGERADRRSDVYGLGAVLYHLLAGRPPFEAPNVEQILLRVTREPPAPLRERDPSTPEDLETITMKCLRKAPAERYESAQALADDLERYLSGEPIVARKLSWIRRAQHFVKRRRGAVAVALFALIAAVGALALEVRGQHIAERRARLSQRLGGEVEALQMLLRMAYLLPLHDVRREEDALRARMDVIAAELAALEGLEAALAHSALGRAHLALREHEAAKEHLEAALAGGIDDSDTHASLGLALGELYRRARRAIEERRLPLQEERIAEAEATWLVPARAHLQKAIGSSAIARPLESARLALYSQRYEDALREADAALAERSGLYEAKKIAADARFAMGCERKAHGEFGAAREAFEQATTLYEEASNIARSDTSVHVATAELWLQTMALNMFTGRSPAAAHARLIDACQHALTADPREAEAYDTQYRGHMTRAYFEIEHGGDPNPWIEEMVTSAKALRTLRPSEALPYQLIAMARSLQIRQGTQADIFMRPWLAEAEESAQKAIELDPGTPDAWQTIGLLRSIEASALRARGGDARAPLIASIEAFERVMALGVPRGDEYEAAAASAMRLLENEIRAGRDVDAIARSAVDLATRGLEKLPGDRLLNRFRAAFRLVQAEAALGSSKDVGGLLDDAEKDLALALASGESAEGRRLLAAAHRLRAEVAERRGVDPSGELTAARAEYAAAVRINPTDPANALEEERLSIAEARLARSRGGARRATSQ